MCLIFIKKKKKKKKVGCATALYQECDKSHYENTPIQIYWNFTTKEGKFSDKKFDIFHISAQNIDYGYSSEPPRRGGSNEYPQSMFLAKIRQIMDGFTI